MENRYRNATIFVRSTSAEKNAIKERMELAGYTDMSSFMREMALKGYIINVNTKELRDVSYELHKIGVNINQVAHRVNESQRVYQTDIDELQRKIDQIWRLIKSNLSDLR